MLYNIAMRRRVLILSIFVLLPFLVSASFERDLFYGIINDLDVNLLQEFLAGEGVYSGPVTGNFLSLTREGVKGFQKREGITPVLGYFGPKTRARANAILTAKPTTPAVSQSREDLIAQITAQIKALQEQIKTLQEKEVSTEAETPSPPPPPPEEKVLPTWLNVEGSATSTFPVVETASFKMGEFVLYNGLNRAVLFVNLETVLYDEMDSTFNRDRKVQFLIKDGTLATDTQVSKTDFTFIFTPPKVGEPHRSPLKLPLDVLIKPGEEKRYSLWIEQLKYVRSGLLRIASTKINTASGDSVVGGINISLTKEPPL